MGTIEAANPPTIAYYRRPEFFVFGICGVWVCSAEVILVLDGENYNDAA